MKHAIIIIPSLGFCNDVPLSGADVLLCASKEEALSAAGKILVEAKLLEESDKEGVEDAREILDSGETFESAVMAHSGSVDIGVRIGLAEDCALGEG